MGVARKSIKDVRREQQSGGDRGSTFVLATPHLPLPFRLAKLLIPGTFCSTAASTPISSFQIGLPLSLPRLFLSLLLSKWAGSLGPPVTQLKLPTVAESRRTAAVVRAAGRVAMHSSPAWIAMISSTESKTIRRPGANARRRLPSLKLPAPRHGYVLKLPSKRDRGPTIGHKSCL